MSAPELSVVCRSCGSEVSPYVTECPYCGTRLRKRAPKLERHGDELQPREPRRVRRQRKRRERAERAGRLSAQLADRPYAVIAAVLVPALLVLLSRTGLADPRELGAIAGPVEGDWWRYLAAPWIYPDVSYLFVTAVGIAIFGSLVERRLGTVATVTLMVACGALGMLAADGIEGAISDAGHVLLAAGGNGVALGLLAAWAALKAGELRAQPDEDFDLIGAVVCAVVLIALPLVEDFANVFAGLGGALVGGACGFATAYARRERRPSR
ncbi:MAG TPA: rhomboid family intramembrane serine protease [Solirubrobacterales bacterium]|nr:rhomboid family intramembrane serine protease [Solirubrobacterales bacterium]